MKTIKPTLTPNGMPFHQFVHLVEMRAREERAEFIAESVSAGWKRLKLSISRCFVGHRE